MNKGLSDSGELRLKFVKHLTICKGADIEAGLNASCDVWYFSTSEQVGRIAALQGFHDFIRSLLLQDSKALSVPGLSKALDTPI